MIQNLSPISLEGGDDSEYFTHLFSMDCDINMFEINKGFILDHMGDDMAIVSALMVMNQVNKFLL